MQKSCLELIKLQDGIPIDINLPFPVFSLHEAIQLRQQLECENEDLILKLQDQKQEMQQKVGTSKVFVLQWSTCVLLSFHYISFYYLRQVLIHRLSISWWYIISYTIYWNWQQATLQCWRPQIFLSMVVKGHYWYLKSDFGSDLWYIA